MSNDERRKVSEIEQEQLVAPSNIRFTEFDEHEVSTHGVLYEDPKMKITDRGVLLYSYWFPFGIRKFIPFEAIKHYEIRRNVGPLEMKSWGMGMDMEVWWHMDFKKSFGERNAIVIDAGGWPKIGFCPGSGNLEDVERAFAILEAHCHEH